MTTEQHLERNAVQLEQDILVCPLKLSLLKSTTASLKQAGSSYPYMRLVALQERHQELGSKLSMVTDSEWEEYVSLTSVIAILSEVCFK